RPDYCDDYAVPANTFVDAAGDVYRICFVQGEVSSREYMAGGQRLQRRRRWPATWSPTTAPELGQAPSGYSTPIPLSGTEPVPSPRSARTTTSPRPSGSTQTGLSSSPAIRAS